MIKALVIESSKLGPVSWWRCFAPFQAMRMGHDIDFTVTENVNESMIMMHDVVIIFRPTEKKYLDFINASHAVGVPVIIDVDDDLLNLEPSHPLFAGYNERRALIREIYAAADWIWCSTEQLMYAFDAFGRGSVVPNAINPDALPSEPAPVKNIAAWRGREIHVDDILANAAWYENIKEVPDLWMWMGWFPPLAHSSKARQTLEPYGNILQYMERIKNSGVNNLWKPLRPGKFNDAKSNISWVEATIGGGICVTNYAGKPGWECAVSDINFDPDYINEHWGASKVQIEKNYSIYDAATKRFNDINRLI